MSNGSNRRDEEPSNSAAAPVVDEGDFDPLKHDNIDGPDDQDFYETSSEDQQSHDMESAGGAAAIAPNIQGGTSFPIVHSRVLTSAEISQLHSRNLQLEQEVLHNEHICRLCDKSFLIDAPQIHQHYKQHKLNNRCPYCEQDWSNTNISLAQQRAHIQKRHKLGFDGRLATIFPNRIEGPFPIEFGNSKEFRSLDDIIKHLEDHVRGQPKIPNNAAYCMVSGCHARYMDMSAQQIEEHKKMHENWQKAIEKAEIPSQKKANTRPAPAATVADTPGPGTANSPSQEGEEVPDAPGQFEEPDVPRRLYCDKCLHIADSPKGVIDLGHLKKCDTTVENCLRLSGPEIKKRRKDRTDEAKAAKTEEAKEEPPQGAPPARRGNKPRGKPGKENATGEEALAPAAVEHGGGGSGGDTPAEEGPEPPVSKTAGKAGKTAAAKKVEKLAKATRSKGATKAAESGPTATTSTAPARKAAGRPKKKTATEAEAQGPEHTEAETVAAPAMRRRGRSGRRNEATTGTARTAPADGVEEAVPPTNTDEELQPATAASNVPTAGKTTRKRKSKMPH